jgi:hypothetical protein
LRVVGPIDAIADPARKREHDRLRMRRIRAELYAKARRDSDARMQAIVADPAASREDRYWAEFCLSIANVEDIPIPLRRR